MELTFQSPELMATGSDPFATHLPDNNIYLFYTRDNKVYYRKKETPMSNWDGTWEVEDLAFADIGMDQTSSKYWSGAFTWIAFTAPDGTQYIANFPPIDRKFNEVFFRGFMSGMLSGERVKRTQETDLNQLVHENSVRHSDYYNGFVLGALSAKNS